MAFHRESAYHSATELTLLSPYDLVRRERVFADIEHCVERTERRQSRYGEVLAKRFSPHPHNHLMAVY
jgi:hypothetical protein